MKTSVMLTLLILGCTLSSCFTYIKSNKSPDFNETLKSVHVVMNMGKRASKFSNALQKKLKKEVANYEVEASFEEFSSLTLESRENFEKRINEMNVDALVIVGQTEGVIGPGTFGVIPMAVGLTMEVTIVIPGTENPIWKASIDSDSSMTGLNVSTTAPTVARTLLGKMYADKLLKKKVE